MYVYTNIHTYTYKYCMCGWVANTLGTGHNRLTKRAANAYENNNNNNGQSTRPTNVEKLLWRIRRWRWWRKKHANLKMDPITCRANHVNSTRHHVQLSQFERYFVFRMARMNEEIIIFRHLFWIIWPKWHLKLRKTTNAEKFLLNVWSGWVVFSSSKVGRVGRSGKKGRTSEINKRNKYNLPRRSDRSRRRWLPFNVKMDSS